MKCPTIDKLSQYVDDSHVFEDIALHVGNCAECQRVVEAFESEQLFIKETLQTPSLPDDFATMVLDQLEPYEQQVGPRKSAPWKRILLSAASVVLALGVSATLNPSFAEWVGGLFSTNQVDGGLKQAMAAGITERVDLEVADSGITFKVEDVIADSDRVALSFQILDSNGKPQDAELKTEVVESGNKVMVIDQNGANHQYGTWSEPGSDYGLIDIRLDDKDSLEKITVKFDLAMLGGVKGNWKLDVPIDLTKTRHLTTTVPLQDAKISQHGVTVNMKEIQFSPSVTKLSYETGFTKEEQTRVKKEVQELEAKFGMEGESPESPFGSYGTDLQFHIVNEDNKVIYFHNAFTEGQGFPSEDMDLMAGSRFGTGQFGQFANSRSYNPKKEGSKLTFVLDGVFKTVPTNFSMKIKPKELKKNPVSFEYDEGNFITINKTEKQVENVLSKSTTPVEPKTVLKIEMEGGIEVPVNNLGTWVLTDDKGNSYPSVEHLTSLVKKDKNSRYGSHETTIEFAVSDMDEVPEELTLHLVSVTRYEEVKEKWEVPLYK